MLQKVIKNWVWHWFFHYYSERRILMSVEVDALADYDNNMFTFHNKFTEAVIVDIRLKS